MKLHYFWFVYIVFILIWSYFLYAPSEWPTTQKTRQDILNWAQFAKFSLLLPPIISLIIYIVIGKVCLRENKKINPIWYEIEFYLHMCSYFVILYAACLGFL